ncbi:hypothetical protein B0H10DRAFT_1913079 [Mycena sp. CBHHK59/15]|nr:hypothetical protein B0H10DRAFT_1913079 [Mycena sp. CBHHK59/15]
MQPALNTPMSMISQDTQPANTTSEQSAKDWASLRATLQTLEDQGMDPESAFLSVIQSVASAPDPEPLDVVSMAHFTDRLGANYVPSDSERRELRDFCARGKQKLEILTRKLETAEIIHGQLMDAVAAIHETLDPFAALSSPMRAMPPEVLQEIFMACLPTEHFAIMHVSECPLLLGRVCSTWRTISLATAALWASMHLVVPYPENTFETAETSAVAIEKRSEAMQIWLQRSGNCPLSISLFVPYRHPVFTQSFVMALLPLSRRWKALKLLQIQPEQLSVFHDLTPDDVPLLETLEVLDTMSNMFEARDVLKFFSIPPNLRNVTLNYFEGNLVLPSCSWQLITTLSLQAQIGFFGLDVTGVMDLVAECRCLQKCRLAFPESVVMDLNVSISSSTPRLVTLPQLHTLYIQGELASTTSFNLTAILARFVLPGLRDIVVGGLPVTVHGGEHIMCDVLTNLEALLIRSSCSLETLSIRNLTGDSASLIRCLHRSPALVSFELDYGLLHLFNPPDFASVLAALVVQSPSPEPPVCPSLLSLRVLRCDVQQEDHTVMVALLRSRCQSDLPNKISRLRTGYVLLHRKAVFDVSELLMELRRYGIPRISIVEPYDYSPHMNRTTRWGGLPEQDYQQY